MKQRKVKKDLCAVTVIFLLIGSLAGCGAKPAETTTAQAATTTIAETTAAPETATIQTTPIETAAPTTEATPTTESEPETTAFVKTYGDGVNAEHPTCPELTYLEDLTIPEYSGEAYIMLNDGKPFFETEGLDPEPYEIYYDLDALGRCTMADCVAGQETMPTEKRGSISSVKPTGWHSDRYSTSLVDGEALYNRCHLIAFGLCGETANQYNLVTGTRYCNTKGMNAFENLVIDTIRETNIHVRYRVTPVWTGDNLVCDGIIVEAWSVEDEGESICFCLYAYNVQPGIGIDYATGDNWLLDESTGETKATTAAETEKIGETLAEDFEGDFVLNIKKMKIHTPDCEGVAGMSEKNRQDYHGSYNELILEGYQPDPACHPEEQ